MTTRTYFCLAFWWRGLYATTTRLMLKWTFCLCVFNVSSKTAWQRQEQLSHWTAVTMVCMFVFSVHGQSAHSSWLKHVLSWFLGISKWNHISWLTKNNWNVIWHRWDLGFCSKKQQTYVDTREVVIFLIIETLAKPIFCSIAPVIYFRPTLFYLAKIAGCHLLTLTGTQTAAVS